MKRSFLTLLLMMAVLILSACGVYKRTEIQIIADAGKASETALPDRSPAEESTLKVPQSDKGTEKPSYGAQTYILNTHTHRFHLPACPSAAEMKTENRKEVTAEREELILQGYQPCGRCRP